MLEIVVAAEAVELYRDAIKALKNLIYWNVLLLKDKVVAKKLDCMYMSEQ